MEILLKNALVFDSESAHHGKRVDILIEDGIIAQIGKEIKSTSAEVLVSENLCVSPGWLDIGTFNGEPGFEHRDDLSSLKRSAAAGGYVAIAPFPNSNPTVDHKSLVEFLLRHKDQNPVTIIPLGCVSAEANGLEIAEILDLHKAGVIAFSDGTESRMDWNVTLRAMLYIKSCPSKIILPALQYHRFTHGQVNEGKLSVSLGMTGFPKVEEEVNVIEILKLSEYTQCPVIIHNVSCRESVNVIHKSDNPLVHTSVSYLNLIYTEENVGDFNKHLKVLPPLREKEDRTQLARAIKKGWIQVITSNHMPLSEEESDLEFGQAPFGSIGIETTFPALNTYAPGLQTAEIIQCLAEGPYNALGLTKPLIDARSKASLTLFDPGIAYHYRTGSIQSRSKNSPFIDHELRGKVLGVIHDGHLNLTT